MQVFAAVAVKVELHAEQTPVLKAQVAQLLGHARQLFCPSLYWPAKQLVMSTH